jgi:ribosomal protein S12 methylthiotransferase accessory factor
MHLSTDRFNRIHHILDVRAGMFNGGLHTMPPRRFFPNSLYQCSMKMENLGVYSMSDETDIVGGSIAFSAQEAHKGAMGELLERYAAHASVLPFVKNSYQNWNLSIPALSPNKIRFYQEWQYPKMSQYLEGNFRSFQENDLTDWVKGYDHITKKEIYIPAFLVYLNYKMDKQKANPTSFLTSTGLAAGATEKQAIIGGLLECAERHAFTQFWYFQNRDQVPMYNQELILKSFPQNEKIKELFNNPSVHLQVFDLSQYVNVETIVTFFLLAPNF